MGILQTDTARTKSEFRRLNLQLSFNPPSSSLDPKKLWAGTARRTVSRPSRSDVSLIACTVLFPAFIDSLERVMRRRRLVLSTVLVSTLAVALTAQSAAKGGIGSIQEGPLRE